MPSLNEFLDSDEVLPAYQEKEVPEINNREELCDFFAEKLKEVTNDDSARQSLLKALNGLKSNSKIKRILTESLEGQPHESPENKEEDQYVDTAGEVYGSNSEAYEAANAALIILRKIEKSYTENNPNAKHNLSYISNPKMMVEFLVSDGIGPTKYQEHPSRTTLGNA